LPEGGRVLTLSSRRATLAADDGGQQVPIAGGQRGALMGRVEKTVFISYRRTTTVAWALNIYQSLTQHGYDVFFDYQGIASGDFESVILENVRARAHFLVLLTPSALERCSEPGDWVRREIETALDTKRNIVPLMFEGFDFGAPAIAPHLTGKLAHLKQYNALNVPADYFLEAMHKLRDRHLNVALEAVLHPVSSAAKQATEQQQIAAAAAAPVRKEELSAEQWFERAFGATDLDEGIRCYAEAIRLKPDYAFAYYNRGNARKAKGDLDGALKDFAEAIRLKPDDVFAYNNRGTTRYHKGDLDGALKDFAEAIRLKPDDADAYYNRGNARLAKGDLDGALKDYDEAIRLKPDYAVAHYNRARLLKAMGQRDLAIADYQKYLDLGEGVRQGDQAEVEGFIRDLKKDAS
jgi:tetratricopeptide (TPR) repeat protein